MRKIVLTITFLLLSSIGYAQNYTIAYPTTSEFEADAIPTGSEFNIILKPQNILGDFNIKVNIGELEYVSVSVGFEQSTLFGTINPPVNQVLTIPIHNINGASIDINLKLRIPQSVCDNQSINITSNIENPLINSNQITVVAHKSNDFYVQIGNHTTSTNATLSYGQTVTYPVIMFNNSLNGGYILTNIVHSINLPAWANVIGVFYDSDGTNIIASNTVVNENTQTVSWILGVSMPSSISSNAGYVIVNYPCNNSTLSSTFDIQATINGNLSPCSSETYIKQSSIIQTTFPAQTDCSEVPLISMTNNNAPCPSCENKKFTSMIKVGLLPSETPVTSLQFTVSIDSNTNLSQAPTNSSFFSAQSIISYSSDGTTFSTLFNAEASFVRYTFTSSEGINLTQNIINGLTFSIFSEFVNEPISVTNLDYYAQLVINTTPYSGILLKKNINPCIRVINIQKSLKRIDTTDPLTTNLDGHQGELFTFVYDITNSNTSQDNITLRNSINQDLIFQGGLKLSYGNTSLEVSSVSSTPENFEFNNQTIMISFNNDTNELVIRNLFLPEGSFCNNSSNVKLIIEFNVKVKLNLEITTQDIELNNSVRLFQNSNNQDNEITPSSSITTTTIHNPIVIIKSLAGLSARMYVKCPISNAWIDSEDGIHAKQGEQVFYKMKFKNFGTTTVELTKLVNTRPYVNDTRGSSYDIFYNCFIPIVKKKKVLDGSTFGNEYISLTSDNISYSSDINQLEGNEGCSALNSKMMFIDFSTLPLEQRKLKPNEFIEIYYKADITTDYPQGSAYNTSEIYSTGSITNGIYFPYCNKIKVNIVTEGGCIPEPCIYCASFDLKNEEKYLISGWVKEVSSTGTSHSSIDITFLDTNDNAIAIDQNLSFYPSGKVIDGWQRIMGEFVVPQGNLENQITLDALRIDLNNSSQDENDKSYFDDIRIIPSKANMKSFVYDQKTQRLMAELDENNYATFYEYDLEGGLVRIKKETEKGVFTIQETRSNSPKKAN